MNPNLANMTQHHIIVAFSVHCTVSETPCAIFLLVHVLLRVVLADVFLRVLLIRFFLRVLLFPLAADHHPGPRSIFTLMLYQQYVCKRYKTPWTVWYLI